MPILPTSILPKNILAIIKRQANHVQVSPLLIEVAQNTADVVLGKLQTNENGLSEEEAQERLEKYGPNVIAQEQRLGRLRLLGHACMNPLVILLLILAVISYLTGDAGAGTVMIIMVFLGVSLRFVQEARADDAAAKLKAMISVTATVVRGGAASEMPLGQLVPGDIIRLAAGDMIPADIRILSCKDLFVIQSSLTGESFPGEKFDAPETGPVKSLLELKNVCFLGTSVESGAATGVVVETGLKTYLGGMASSIIGQEVQTSFDKGVGKFTWLMIYFMMVMVPLGVPHQRPDKTRLDRGLLFRLGRGRGHDARNAAHDRHRLPVQGRYRHVAKKSDRKTLERHPESRRHGHSLRRQNRHAHLGPRDSGTALRRGPQGRRRSAGIGIS